MMTVTLPINERSDQIASEAPKLKVIQWPRVTVPGTEILSSIIIHSLLQKPLSVDRAES